VANRLTGSELSDIIHNLKRSGNSGDVLLSLPKFKLETQLELVRTLKEVFSARQTKVPSSNLVTGFHRLWCNNSFSGLTCLMLNFKFPVLYHKNVSA